MTQATGPSREASEEAIANRMGKTEGAVATPAKACREFDFLPQAKRLAEAADAWALEAVYSDWTKAKR